MKKIIATLLILTLAISVAACGKSSGDSTELVKVGDTTINEKQLDEYVSLVGYISGSTDLSQIPEESMKEIKSMMLSNMIDLEVLKQYYAGKKKEILPQNANEDLDKFIKESKSNETVKQFLDKSKISDETLTTFFYSQFYAEAFYKEAAAEIPTLEADAKASYEKNKENYKVDEIRASHILIGDKEHKAEDKALAEEVLQKIKDGAKFEDMAAQYGTDGTKNTGGDLDWFGKGRMDADFEKAAYSLQIGQVSDIVETQFGYHIIKLTDKREYKPYEEVEETIKQSMVDPVYNEKIEKLRDKIGVEYLSDKVKEPTENSQDKKS